MSRRIKIKGRPSFELLTVSERDGVWEGEWEGLRGTLIGKLLSEVDRRTVDDAIRGHDAPLRQALGISPEGALRKLPSRECVEKKSCTFYDSQKCKVLAKEMPWCFKPAELDLPENLLTLAYEIITAWKKQMPVVIVRENA